MSSPGDSLRSASVLLIERAAVRRGGRVRGEHDCLKRIVFAENFFVALLDSSEKTISFTYFVDQYDENPGPLPRSKTCTDYILRTGQPLLLTDELFEALVAEGEIELVGSPSPSWMGVPLKTSDKTIGVLAVQHYEDEGAFSEQDLELCASVAGHIAWPSRKRGRTKRCTRAGSCWPASSSR